MIKGKKKKAFKILDQTELRTAQKKSCKKFKKSTIIDNFEKH